MNRNSILLMSIIVAISSGWSSLFIDLKSSLLATKLSQTDAWIKKSNFTNKLQSKFVYNIYFAFSYGCLAHSVFRNWSRGKGIVKDTLTIKPNEIYYLDDFTLFYDRLFSSYDLCESWKQTICNYLTERSSILEIGAGSGKLTQWLLKHNYSIKAAIEPNVKFVNLGNQRLRSFNFSISNKKFFIDELENKYDAIVMHQNVFIELINEFDSTSIIEYIHSVLSPKGLLIIDYPIELNIPEVNRNVRLFSGNVEGLGQVNYEYKYLGMSTRSAYDIKLKYEVYQSEKSAIYNYKMTINYLDIKEIINSFKINGYNLKEILESSYYSFISPKLAILVFESI